jgi:alkylation response protein AidB-like acyl-CoA dehydrogenase
MKGEAPDAAADRPISAPSEDWIGRVAALAPCIAGAVEEIERERRLPQALVGAMAEAGLFRLLLPRSVDGAEADPLTFARVLQEIARIDGSTAWCLGQTAVCAMVAAFLPIGGAREIFLDRRSILTWGSGTGQATAVDGGYRVTGNWSFASGGHHATWLGGHCLVHDRDGALRKGGDGSPPWRTMLFPAAEAPMTDVWQVIGLRGTGSDAYAVTDLFVPESHSVARDDPAERREAGPLYCFKTDNLFACGFASVALGLARRMLDDFIALAKDKQPRGYARALRDSAAVQTDVGELEARLRAAHHYLMGTIAEVWHAVERSNHLALEQRMAIRLAATRTIEEAVVVADAAYHAAGATAIFARSAFERRFRDIHAVAQQLQARRSHFETVGKFLLGLEADTAFL